MFGKFMNKKFFHPGSYPNIKQKWIHEQRAAAKDKNEQDKKDTYQKEQESYQSRLLTAKSCGDKMKLGLNFMYDQPPGMKKEVDEPNEQGETEIKFEWQKTAPRSKYITDLGLECQDQPFGVCVRNIRCFKCKEWGHQNTDRECPLFFTDLKTESKLTKSQTENLRLSDPLRLVADMRKQHGIVLKSSVIGQEIDPMADNQQLIESDDDSNEIGDADIAFIESLTDKQKRKLLKSLNKLDRKSKKHKKRRKSGTIALNAEQDEYLHHKKKTKKSILSANSKHWSSSKAIVKDNACRRTLQKYKKLHKSHHRHYSNDESGSEKNNSHLPYSHQNYGFNDSDTDNETNRQIRECRKRTRKSSIKF